MATDPTTLPQWKGKPVPWVARWSGEKTNDAYVVQVVKSKDAYNLRVAYEHGEEIREKSGVLWQREGIARGGDPMFGDVSTYRQRLAMTRRKCQVCGSAIEKSDKGTIPWIIEKFEITASELQAKAAGQDWRDFHITTTPPVCEDCVPLALSLCPHLKKHGAQILDVLDYEIWGVFGEVVYLDDEGKHRRTQTSIEYEGDYGPGFSLEAVLAKQQVAKITKFKVREEVKP